MSLPTSTYWEARNKLLSFTDMKDGWYGCPCCDSKAPTGAAIDSALLILDALRDVLDRCNIGPLIDGGIAFEVERQGTALTINVEDDAMLSGSEER